MTPSARAAALVTPTGTDRDLADEVRRYLTQQPRQLPSRLLYDALGSSLFDAICQLPWYPITRAETRLLEAHAGDIMAGDRAPARVVELGAGNGAKLAVLLGAGRGAAPPVVHLVDVSPTALDVAARAIAAVSSGPIRLHQTTFEDGLADISATRGGGRTLVAFLGSNLGNFDSDAARAFLREMRAGLTSGDLLLLGVDLVKTEREMVLAYDDPLGVTAAFNLNLLVRLNHDLGADFNLREFRHRAVWNAVESRIEMHLVSATRQRVRLAGADLEVLLHEGESIWTESSYKYTTHGIERLLGECGFRVRARWVDETSPFALTLSEC
jgi:L-histidine N-alpha-methyltransferase